MSGKALTLAGALATCLAILACEQPTDPLQPAPRQLLIHCVLDVLGDAQTVKVEWIGGAPNQPRYAHDATVTITASGGRMYTGTEVAVSSNPVPGVDPPSVYRFAGDGLGPFLVPGEYTLRVRTQTGEEATGTATVPSYTSAPNDTTDVTPFTVARDTLRLSWPRVPGARSYEVDVSHTNRGRPFSELYAVFADTSVSIPGTQRSLQNEPVFSPGSVAFIQVSAVDDNYYTYYHPIVDPFAGAPPSRLKGAVGVFGVMVPVLRLVRQVVQ